MQALVISFRPRWIA